MPETCIVLVPKMKSSFFLSQKKVLKLAKLHTVLSSAECSDERYGATLKCHENIQTLIP